MGAVRVTTPGGAEWVVRRRWLPHREGIGPRERFRRHRERRQSGGEGGRWYDAIDIPAFGDELAAIFTVIALVVLIVVIVLFGWPLVLIGIDLVWLLLVGLFGTIGRVVLRRPWRVEAVSGTERRDWYVRGFRAAGAQRDEIARRLRHGQNPVGNQPGALAH